MRNLLLGSLFLSLAGSIWGAMFIAVRCSIFVIAPIPLVWLRYGTALLALLALMVLKKASWYIAPKDRKILLIIFLLWLKNKMNTVVM